MTNLKTKLTTGLVTASLLASSFAPAAFAADVNITGNGALSHNSVSVKLKKVTKVSQYNRTAVVNLVGVSQKTGDNKALFNTGDGPVTVNSGSATATVTNTTNTGRNSATVTGCCCGENGQEPGTIDIVDNGALSHNHVYAKNKCVVKAEQSNKTLVVNGVHVYQNTGDNSASFNTGGAVDVGSGNANATVSNSTTTGLNTLVVN